MSYFLSRRIASAEQNLDGVQNSITALSTSTTTLSGNVSSLQGNITSISNSISQTQGNVSSLQGNITSISNSISQTQGNVSILQGNITSINNINTQTQGNVSSIQTSITDINGRLGNHDTMLFNHDFSIGVALDRTTALAGNITSINTNYLVKSLTAGTNITTANSNGNWTISALSSTVPSYLIVNQLVSTTPSIDGYTTNGWTSSSTITWDFDNFEYDIQFDLQIGAVGYYPLNIFWSWDGILGASNQYHHSWMDHDGNSVGGFLGAGQDGDNRINYTYGTANTHHNFNMILKRVRAPHVSYNQRLLLECNCNQIIVGGGTSNITSARMPFSRTNNYHFANSTIPSVFNGSKALVFYGKLNNCASVSVSGNYAWLKIRKIPIS
jgi:hypothetical protein